jgi:hypothetical protein
MYSLQGVSAFFFSSFSSEVVHAGNSRSDRRSAWCLSASYDVAEVRYHNRGVGGGYISNIYLFGDFPSFILAGQRQPASHNQIRTYVVSLCCSVPPIFHGIYLRRCPFLRACSSCNDRQFDQTVIWWKAPPDRIPLEIELQHHFSADTDPHRQQFPFFPFSRHVFTHQWAGDSQWHPERPGSDASQRQKEAVHSSDAGLHGLSSRQSHCVRGTCCCSWQGTQYCQCTPSVVLTRYRQPLQHPFLSVLTSLSLLSRNQNAQFLFDSQISTSHTPGTSTICHGLCFLLPERRSITMIWSHLSTLSLLQP